MNSTGNNEQYHVEQFATMNSAMMNTVNNYEQCMMNSIDSCEQYLLWWTMFWGCFVAETATKATKEATIKVAKVYAEARPLVIESSDAMWKLKIIFQR